MAQGKAPQDFKGTASGGGNEYSMTFTGPDWAKEATQALINKKLGSIDKKLNAKGGLGAMLKAALDNNTDAIKDLKGQQTKDNKGDNTSQDETKKHQSKTQKAADDLFDATMSNAQALKDLGKLSNQGKAADSGIGGSLGDLATKRSFLGVFMNGIAGATKAVYQFAKGILGVATTLTLAIGRQITKVLNLLNDSLTNGTAGLVGALQKSSVNISAEASRAGLGLREFTEALEQNSEEIMVLGAKGYASLRTATIDTANGLFELGFANEEVTKLLGREISIRARMGMRLEHGGDELARDIVSVAGELRRIGAVAGISAEALYDASKLSDETNTLIAARARNLGDDGISALQTSIRKLTIRMAGLSPTYANAITEPLVNAIITGAVGLDEGFTDLVTVFPGLVSSMSMAQQDIANSGEITDSTITDIMENLRTTSDDEFDRAKQMALMTRNQTAILAVNFASEARARDSLFNNLNDQGVTLRNSAIISGQASIFFDMLKAPLENAMSTFMFGFLGVSNSGKDMNLGVMVSKFATLATDFVHQLPIIGAVLEKNGFINQLNQTVNEFFAKDATQGDKADARKQLQQITVQLIEDLGAGFGQVILDGTVAREISTFFSNLMDQISIQIYESTGMGAKTAAMAYMRAGDKDSAFSVDSWGYDAGTVIGEAIEDKISRSRKKLSSNLGVDDSDAASFQATYNNGEELFSASLKRDKAKLMKKYNLSEDDFVSIAETYDARSEVLRQLLIDAGYDFAETTSMLKDGAKFANLIDGGRKIFGGPDEMDQGLAQLIVEGGRGLFDSLSGSGSPATRFDGTHVDSPSAMNRVSRNLTGKGATYGEQKFFKDLVVQLNADKTQNFDATDGINKEEKDLLTQKYKEFLEDNRKMLGDQASKIDDLINSMNGLRLTLDTDNANT